MNHKCNTQRLVMMDGSIQILEDYYSRYESYGRISSSDTNTTSTSTSITASAAVSEDSAIQLRNRQTASGEFESSLSSITSLKFESATRGGTKRPSGLRTGKANEGMTTSSSIVKKKKVAKEICMDVMVLNPEDVEILPNLTNLAIMANNGRLSKLTILDDVNSTAEVKEAFDKAQPPLPFLYDICLAKKTGELIAGVYNVDNLPDCYHGVDVLCTPIVGTSSTKRKLLVVRTPILREENCGICMNNMPTNNYFGILQTLKCNHTFHKACIGEWLRVKDHNDEDGFCPLCKAVVVI